MNRADPARNYPVNKAALLKGLTNLLPPHCVLDQPAQLQPYECDGLSAYQVLPLAVVLPETEEQVRQILELCNQQQVPVVARGAGTGLSGGALPFENGIVLSLAKFNQILNIDTANCTATVQPGVRNLAISQAAAPNGLYYAPDPSSQIACTIGGNVAENSGGVHCLKYGLTVHNILQIRGFNIAGEALTIGSQTLDAPGFDLLALMTGSEGLLAIITEVTVKLLPNPTETRVLLAAFDTIGPAGKAVGDIIAKGIIPDGLEMMDQASIRAAEDFAHAGYPTDAAAILLCELDGIEAEVRNQVAIVKQVLLDGGASEVRIAKDENERTRFWAGRKGAFPAIGRISPDYYCMDGTIPRHQLPTVLKRIAALSDQHGLAVANVFHAGDGNLHPLILFDANIEGQLETAEAFGADILELCVSVGGTITGEHGVGMEKLNQMCSQFNAGELQQFHAIKHAFDPDLLLNPGKAIPTLNRCAEFGAMHVRQGQTPFPDLERF